MLKLMKKLIKPIKPVKPTKPDGFLLTKRMILYLSDYDNMQSLIDDLNKFAPDAPLSEFFLEGDDRERLIVSHNIKIRDPQYKNQLQKYQQTLKKYPIKLKSWEDRYKQYLKAIKDYKEAKNIEDIDKLKKELRRLENK